MKFADMDEMWHAIREKRAAENEGLSPAEVAERDNARAAEIIKRLGLKVTRETSRRARAKGRDKNI